jgi:hypothetical protein
MAPFATLLSYAPLLIAFKSGWELSRMIRDKRKEQHYFDTEKAYISKLLDLAYSERLIEVYEYLSLWEMLIRACKYKDRQFAFSY